nr:hypothetical protein [Tanacetum cinerariifolium]
EKVQNEKVKEVKARLNFEGCSRRNSKVQEVSQHSESQTPNVRVAKAQAGGKGKRDGGVFNILGDKGKSVPAHSESRYQSYRSKRTKSIPKKRHHERTCSQRIEMFSKSKDSGGGHLKSKSKKQRSSIEDDDLSQPWVCEEIDPFTSRIRYSDLLKKTMMPNNVKTYDGSDDPEDHLKIFQADAKVECWAMPTWFHMFNSTLTGSARDPVEIHHIKQREGESTKDFMQRFKAESRHVKGASRISGFMHRITNPELIKQLHDNIPKSVDEMMRVTTAFLKGEVAASNQAQKHFRHGNNRNLGGSKTSIEMETSRTKKGRNTDECMHMKRHIEELIKAGKLSRVIKELKQGSGKDQPNAAKKGQTFGKDKSIVILMVQPWKKVARKSITQSFSPDLEISFPPLGNKDETEGPMIIEEEIIGHFICRIEEIIWPMGQISLLVKIGDEEHFTSTWMNFMVVTSPSPYNRIIGRPGVRRIQAVPSTAHGMLKFLVPGGILTLRSSRIIPLECTMVFGPKSQPSNEGRKSMCELLRRNLDIFAWKPEDMTGVPRHLVEHRLNVREGCSPRLVNKAFQKQIGRNLEVYVDDLVIKSRTEREIIRDIEETFKTLKEINMKLNSKKCTFGIEEDMFLGYKVNTKGIKQKKSLPFFKTLKKCTKKSDFQWTTEVEVAFKEMKKLIAELQTLTTHREKEELIVYLAAALEAVSAVLMTKKGQSKCKFTSPRTSVKRQILADFIVERLEDDPLNTYMEAEEELSDPWTLFDVTNNEAEYEALIAGLKIAEQMEVLVVVEEEGDTLMTPIYKYLTEETLPTEKEKARYACRNEICGSKGHTDRVLLANNACGCKKDDKGISRLQVHHPMPRNPQQKLTPIISPWPFYKWRIDIAGPFSEGPGKGKFLILAIDYFTKWIEAKEVATITVQGQSIQILCEKLCIRQRFASVKHPQTNGLVERANRSLGEGIKVHLDERSKDWIEEISHVLWAHRTMIKSSNGDTLFSLAYGTKAVIPAEIGMPTLRTAEVDMVQNDEALEINLDLLEERREQAAIREARSKAKMKKYYDSKVRNISFKLGDLVYRNNDAIHAKR